MWHAHLNIPIAAINCFLGNVISTMNYTGFDPTAENFVTSVMAIFLWEGIP